MLASLHATHARAAREPPLRCVYYFGLDDVARFRFDRSLHAKVWYCDGPDEQACREWIASVGGSLLPADLKLLAWDSRHRAPPWPVPVHYSTPGAV